MYNQEMLKTVVTFWADTVLKFIISLSYWASEASPTLECSIEISRDIYIYVGMSVVS